MRIWQLSQANALRLRCLLFMGLLIGAAPRVLATTYFVDPSGTCANSNVGTLSAAPWCNPPGTWNTGNTARASSAWGAINGTTKVACGDLILLHGGSSHTSARGGWWNIDNTYYTNTCTPANPITITVATSAQWAGSSGDFVVDGTGITNASDLGGTAGAGTCPGGHHVALVGIERLSGIVFGGNSANQRFHVQNVANSACNDVGIMLASDSGIEVRWVEVNGKTTNDQGGGIDVGQTTQATVHDAYVHDWQGPGVDSGMSANQTVQGLAWVDVTVENNGPPVDTGQNAADDAYSTSASAFSNTDPAGGGTWCLRCTAKNGYWNGTDSGGSTSPGMDGVVRYRNFYVYGQGRTASSSSIRSGFESAGDACPGGQGPNSNGQSPCLPWTSIQLPTSSVWVMYSIFYDNFNFGVTMPHGDGAAYIWNTTFFRAGAGSAIRYDNSAAIQEVYNSIVSGSQAFSGNQGNNGLTAAPLPVSANSLYYSANNANQMSSVQTYCSANTGKKCRLQTDCTAGDGSCITNAFGSATYANPPGFTIGNGNLVGSAFDPKFTNATGACDTGFNNGAPNYASCNFTLQAGSPAIDAGTYFLRTNGAGNNSTTITVKASTPEPYQVGGAAGSYPPRFQWSPAKRPHIDDPRMYFIAANSFPHAAAYADAIQIQGATCNPPGNPVVMGMTATTITLDRSCTWADGSGVHLPWSGAAPDMGAHEYGSGPPPPNLVFVNAVTPTPGP